ncbi:MAG: hypothetical protein ACI4S2_12320 [Lachnospiraceae bacterium]
MSKMYFPFNSIVIGGMADRAANAESFAAYFRGLIKNGVLFKGTSLKVTPGSSMTVNVQAGTAYIDGKIYLNDEAEVVNIEAAAATLSRIDRVVLRLDEINRLIGVYVLKGTPAATPAAPALTRTADVYELCLAEIRLPAGATSVASSYITDTRSDPDLCGWVTNLVQPVDDFIYRCNGKTDNVTLRAFIDTCLALQDKVSIKIKGQFGYDSTRYTVNSNSYIFAYTGSNNNVTLDFTDCGNIASDTNFIYAQGITIKGLAVNATGGSHIIGGSNAIFKDCSIKGQFVREAAVAYLLNDSRLIDSLVFIKNTAGTATGISGSYVYMTDCDITAESTTASAYGADIASSRAQGCIFRGITDATATTASGNGAIASGQYTGCTFEGIGALKGQGLFLRAGYYLQATNCIFRGYTANTTDGWGIGFTGAASDAITVSLFGINCNQVALSGYEQTGSCKLAQGHGSIAGLFFTAIDVPATIVSYGAFNRNRV